MGQGSDGERVSAYLKSLDQAQLVEIAYAFIAEDPYEMSRWALRAEAASGELKPSTLKKRVTKALPYRDLWKYSQVASYFRSAETLLDEVFALLGEVPAADAFKLVAYGYQRLNRALERIDDSGGYRFAVETGLQEALASALDRHGLSAQERAARVLEIVEWDYDVLPDPAALLPTPEVNAAFYAEGDRRWRARGGDVSFHLSMLLQRQAEAEEDLPRLIEYKSAGAAYPREYSRLVDLNLRVGDFAAADHWLERLREALPAWQADHWRARYVDVLRAKGDITAALAEQWLRFEEDPRPENYDLLVELSAESGGDPAACFARAETLLVERAGQSGARFGFVPSEPLIELYRHTGAIDAAVDAAKRYPVSLPQLCALAGDAFAGHPDAAFEFYERAISATAETSQRHAYERMVQLLQELQAHVQGSADDAMEQRFDDLLTRIRDQHPRKRTLLGLLDQAFGVR